MKSQKNIAIIPARGGSKRLPNKNILPLNSKPLIEYSIDYALANSTLMDDIVVSTDSKDIKEIALQNNIKVIDRPETLSGDLTPTVAVLKHALQSLDQEYDNVILLQVTNPLRPKNLLEEAYKQYVECNCDSLMTVTRNHQKFGKIVNDKFQAFNYKMGQRSQDLEPLYFENGLLYISKSDLILKDKILGDNNYPFVVNHPFANVDIDLKDDLELAEFIQKKYAE